MSDSQTLENRLYDELEVGDSASLSRSVTEQDIALFAHLSGDVNPAHMDPEFAENTMFKGVIVHGMWTAGLVSAVLGTKLPGPGAIYLEQSLQFRKPVKPGDTITATVEVQEKGRRGRITLHCTAHNQDGVEVLRGTALVAAPTEKISREAVAIPRVSVEP